MTRSPLVVIAAAALALAGCAAPADDSPAASSASAAPEASASPTAAAFPLTLEIAGDDGTTSVEIPAEPVRIAALSYETATVVAALGLTDRLVSVPEAVLSPTLSELSGELAQVPSTTTTESETDPEAIIALDPDLVLLSDRHGLEEGAGRVLADVGIPVVVIPNSWAHTEDLLANVDLIARATGATEAGARLTATLAEGLTPTTRDASPRILVLSNQAGRPFVTAGAAFPIELVRLAGGVDASAELGFAHSGPITAEQVVEIDPDGIVLIDMNGTGERMFADLLANEAVATLAAVSERDMLRLDGRHTQALGLTSTVEGLDALSAWADTLPASE